MYFSSLKEHQPRKIYSGQTFDSYEEFHLAMKAWSAFIVSSTFKDSKAPFTRGRLQVNTPKYFIGSAFRLDGDSVFGAQKRKNLKPPSRVENLNTLRRSDSVYTAKTENYSHICSRRVRVYVTNMPQYREINKHVGLFPCFGPSSCSNKRTGVFQRNVQDMYKDIYA